MKLKIPELIIDEDAGFHPDIDIFERKVFGENLANLIEGSGGDLVLALDASWGEGKSTFVKMWRGYVEHVRDEKIKTIYFDAFANDYQKEPFLALAAEIYDSLDEGNTEITTKFKEKAVNVLKGTLRGGELNLL